MEDVRDIALFFAGIGLLVAGLSWLHARWEAAKLRGYEAGEPQRITVRAKGVPPFPHRWARGSIDTGERPLTFRRWHRLGGGRPLDRMTLVRTTVQHLPPQDQAFAVYRLRDDQGRVVDLAVADVHDELLARALRDAAPARRRPRPGPVSLVFAALSLLWLGAWTYLFLAGSVVSATVLANDEDFCRVEWRLDGRRDTASVDCYGERPGDRVDVLALPPPFRGEAADVGFTAVAVPVLAVVGLLPLGSSLRRRLRYRPPPAHAPVAPAVVHEAVVPRVTTDELTYATVVATVARRAEQEAWDADEAPWWLRPFRTSRSRLVAASLPWTLGTLLFATPFVLIIGATPATTALRYDPATAREVTATVTVVDGFAPPIPWDVEVEVDVDGRREHVRVAMTREPENGDRLAVRYDAAHGVARAVEHDGVGRGLAAAATLAVAASLVALWRAGVLVRALRAFRRASREPGVPTRYAVTVDGEGVPLMLLFGDDGRPGVVVPMGSLPAGVPVAGDAVVHGHAADGEHVLVWVGGEPLYPTGPAMALDPAELTALVNGDAVDFDDEP